MSAAQERAEALARDPKVRAWIKRFQAVSRDMPPGVWVFIASSTPCVMALDPQGREYTVKGDGMDRDAEIDSATGGHWSGGDW